MGRTRARVLTVARVQMMLLLLLPATHCYSTRQSSSGRALLNGQKVKLSGECPCKRVADIGNAQDERPRGEGCWKPGCDQQVFPPCSQDRAGKGAEAGRRQCGNNFPMSAGERRHCTVALCTSAHAFNILNIVQCISTCLIVTIHFLISLHVILLVSVY